MSKEERATKKRAKSADWISTTCCEKHEEVRRTPKELGSWKNSSVPDVRFFLPGVRGKFPGESARTQDWSKFGRSLRLLGFRPDEFGICDSERRKITGRLDPRKVSSTLSTRVTSQSVSLEYLRQCVGKVCVCHGLDDAQRRLLAQAAYEQWYFKKEEELLKKKEEKKKLQKELRETLEKEIHLKREKANEEFQKWAKRKRKKMKLKSGVSTERILFRKSSEDVEKAFLKWKAEKDKELKKKKEKEKEEKEKEMEFERQKREKKIIAEKAFEQWKAKQDESKKIQKEKQKRFLKNFKGSEEVKRRQETSVSSFLAWKKIKDEEIKMRLQQQRTAEMAAREERKIMLEERMYEAEQAFEDWLEKIDTRKPKQFVYNQIPWLPP